ncbi:MAG: DnaJ domain-containing protein [Desulfomonile tiedjei]|nr:DnaJ domain-containing protein [Desulfomonile tiedjei]
MHREDLYNILGVSQSASEEDIRRAYRRLARLCHPDLHQNDPRAEAQFKALAAAYEVLGDTSRRRDYDTLAHDGTGSRYPGSSVSSPWSHADGAGRVKRDSSGTRTFRHAYTGQTGFEDILWEILRDRGRGRQSSSWQKGSDVQQKLSVAFEQAYHGALLDFRCLGNRVHVRVPAGVENGAKMRLPARGAAGPNGGPRGDLLLEIEVLPHRYFRREGNHIHLVLPVTVGEAVFGVRLEIPGPDGPLTLKIPAGTQSGTVFRFGNFGFPSLQGDARGDFFVTTHVVVPERLDPASRKLLEELERRNAANPREALWGSEWRTAGE